MPSVVLCLVCIFALNAPVNTEVSTNSIQDEPLTSEFSSLLQTQLLRSKRLDVGKESRYIEEAGKKANKEVKKPLVSPMQFDVGNESRYIEEAGKKANKEVKKPLVSPMQTPQTPKAPTAFRRISVEEYLRQREGRGTADDPCDVTPVDQPDFAAPGLRISEIKCAEYTWRANILKYIRERNEACITEMTRRGLHKVVMSGENTKPGQFPHMAAIGWKATSDGSWLFKCGGSLISPTFVLTAGHCISASTLDGSVAEAEPRMVRLGDKNIIDKVYDGVTPVDKNIIRRIPHPQYLSPKKKYYDVALFELESEANFTLQVHPACLWTKPEYRGTDMKAIITSWGVIQSGGREQSPELQKATVDILETPTCSPLLKMAQNRHLKGFQDHEMCAGVLAGGPDTCQGDSGGPLQVKKEEGVYWVVGVTSFGRECGKDNKPGVFSRVYSFLDWLESVVWG